MPPRKRSSTNTAANGPSKRAKATEEERTPPDAEVSPSGSSTDGSVEPTPEASASETIGPDANVPETNNPDASATAPPRSARQVPRPARFSEVSATANTWQHWRHFVAKDPAHAYTFACLCRLPHHRVFEELDPFEEVDPEEQQEEEDDEERGVCNGGETCICEKPASERPGHKIYTFNDHGAFGAVEVVENLLVDFDGFKEGWRDRWAICEAMVLYFLGHASEEMFMLPDPEKLKELVTLVATMFLTILHQLEKERLFGPDSEVANVGMVMGLYIQFLSSMEHDHCLLEQETSEDGSRTGASAALGGGILAYAKKHGIEIKGSEVLVDLIPEMDEDVEILGGVDPWGFGEKYDEYARELGMGGDEWDITTWKPKERKEAAFDGKDPMTRVMIREIKNGAIMQPA